MTRSPWVRALTWLTLVSLVESSCHPRAGMAPHGASLAAPSPLSDQVLVQTKELPPGLDLRVSSGREGPPAFDRARLAPAKRLPDAEAETLLQRARPIHDDGADRQAFALRPSSQPPPRTGQTIKAAFPPPASTLLPPPAAASGSLEVVRFMPEGDVPVAPELTVTFNQPMIAVTSQEDAATAVPVKLTPQPRGKWRWVGTRTIVFDPEVRFPQAQTYQVEIPAGTRSATGAALKDAVRFKFETPPPTLVASSPGRGESQRVDTPMFALFDQKIDPAAVLANIHVTAAHKAFAVRPLTPEELAKNKQLAATIEAAKKNEQDGRWVAFRTTEDLPKDAQVEVEIAAGTPSAEGPNVTRQRAQFDFHTYPPLALREARCGWNHQCPPGTPFQIEMNNELDADKFDDALVTVTPQIPGVKIVQANNMIVVSGLTAAHTTYHVAVGGSLTDAFGQTLGKPADLAFTVGDAVPTFFGPSGMVVLDPAERHPTLDFFTTNYEQLKVKLYAVEPGDLDAYARYTRERWNHDHPPAVPGKKVLDALVKTAPGQNQLVETHVDLAPALHAAGLGHAIAIVEPYPWKERYSPPMMIAWVQSTRLAVDAHVDGDSLVAFASELGTGKPAGGVALELRPFGIKATTDDKGLATLPLGTRALKAAHYLTARRGDDVAFVTDDWSEYGSWVKQARPGELAWYVTDDRKLYKPGEDVSIKGWLRRLDLGKGGDVGGIAGQVGSIAYKVYDQTGNQIATGTTTVSPVGGFDTRFTLPKTPNLGEARIDFSAQGALTGTFSHGFQIEEFRRPEFEVSAQASQGPFVVGGSGDVTVSAKYFAGGPLPGADTSWYVTASPTSFTPPNRDDYVFGNWEPWWGFHEAFDEAEGGGTLGRRLPKSWTLQGKTDATGAHVLHLDFLSLNPAMPMSVAANASVTDVNRQTWSASSALIVHPSSLYVGLKAKRPFVDQGTPFDLDVIGVDLDGKAAPGAKIEVKAERLDWEYKKGKYRELRLDPQTCEVVAAKNAVPCSFATKHGGRYEVVATIIDGKGRPNQTKLEFWVSGGDVVPSREVKQDHIPLIPDKKEYRDGDTAELLVQAPFAPAEGVVTWRRGGIVKTERITLTGSTATVKVPVSDQMTPNMVVQVDLVGMAVRADDNGDPDPHLPRRPAYAVGTIDLSVPPRQRTLAVAVAPSAPKLGPGEATRLAISVKDAQGRPVAGAETAVIVVDEAVLSLTGYQFASPIDAFYVHRDAGARDYYSRSYVQLARPGADTLAQAPGGCPTCGRLVVESAMEAEPAAPMAVTRAVPVREAQKKLAKEEPEKPSENAPAQGRPIAVRTNFNPLAAFSPTVKTDADGRATVEVKVPDNLTRYRIVAIAAAGDKQFGKGENALTARLPLMVRPSPPRFLNFGDTFQLPVVLQNQTDAAMTVKVAARATNAKLTDGAGREVTVPANDRVEVRFPAAAELAGTARFQIVGAAGPASDAAELALPVWTPATTEAFATYGVIDEGAQKQPIALPGKVVTQFGGLEVETASTNVAALTDALLYLVHYPFECAEQRSSRILAIATLRDVLEQFKTKDMPSRAEMEKSVADDIEHLSQMQNSDGGFAFWDRGYPSMPYLSVFVIDALAHAKAKGFAVPKQVIDNARGYLHTIERYYPAYYPKQVRWAISAFALYARKQIGEVDIAKGQALLKEAGGVDKVTMETDGWLLGVFAGDKAAEAERKAIVRYAQNHVSETAGAANFTTGYADGNYLLLSSDRRVDGVMLESLILAEKGEAGRGATSDLIPKVVSGLLAHRKAGRWLNTQENAFALSALDLYFQTYEKVTPDFVARVWLGNDYAGDHPFKGRQTERYDIAIPMQVVATHDKADLTIQKDGKGRMYYRIGMTYAPASLRLAPADYGFVVERRYEAVDDPKDVMRAKDGAWHIKSGARVRVRLTMVNENRRYHVALVDPLPAGLETMNPALAVTGPIPTDPKDQQARGRYWWWYGPWYEHQNLRDERVEAFASLLWEGVHDYTYVARATTPGNFVVPPPKAEEMYMPETFGRGASDRVIVE